MIRIFIYSLIFVYCCADEIKHVVVKGDTLWDISGKYLKDNFRWKEIYEANKDKIKDPDLIYPGQEFRIFISTPVVKVEPSIVVSTPAVTQVKPEVAASTPVAVQSTEEAKEVKPAEPTTISTTETVEGEEVVPESKSEAELKLIEEEIIKIKPTKTTFIAPFEWEPDGVIIGSQEEKEFLNINDVVYINAGRNKNLKPNMKCYIYRATAMPKLGGTQMKFIGILRVTEQIGDDLSTGIIINVQEPIRVEDPILILYE